VRIAFAVSPSRLQSILQLVLGSPISFSPPLQLIDEAKVDAKFDKRALTITAAKKPEAVKAERRIAIKRRPRRFQHGATELVGRTIPAGSFLSRVSVQEPQRCIQPRAQS
jgi:hypothetical protein